jgi:hypothetical protein
MLWVVRRPEVLENAALRVLLYQSLDEKRDLVRQRDRAEREAALLRSCVDLRPLKQERALEDQTL